jgi:hypothetical protein
MTAHAKNRPPSAAKRWLSCPYSASIVSMYPRDETDASLKGDQWHEYMETILTYGTLPVNTDPDAYDAMHELLEYTLKRFSEMGGAKQTKMFVEQRLDIPQTREFGTADIILVSDKEIEIIDEKSGYVPVEVKMNPQLMIYLLGAIALHGPRKKYTITLHQPNYDHVDGSLRSYAVNDEDIEWLEREIKYALANEDQCSAGKHCKETYCDHRGSCQIFMDYVQRDLKLGWHTSEIKSISDEMLSTALDAADELSGWRNSLRSEAMRRIMNMDRKVNGYKVVKGRKSRAVVNPSELANAMYDAIGAEWAIKLFPDLSPFLSALSFPLIADDPALKFIGSAKHVEDICKLYCNQNRGPRGAWKTVYDTFAAPYIRDTANGLTLERAIDARPSHKRGSEFGSLVSTPNQVVTII